MKEPEKEFKAQRHLRTGINQLLEEELTKLNLPVVAFTPTYRLKLKAGSSRSKTSPKKSKTPKTYQDPI